MEGVFQSLGIALEDREMDVIILRGIPGSGKSEMAAHWVATKLGCADVCSADDYMVDEAGDYHFDPALLADCHNRCLRRFVELMRSKGRTPGALCVVDNTNCTLWEAAPYAENALAYGASVRVLVLLCDPEVAFQRNVHGVPLVTIQSMDQRLRSWESIKGVPSFWNQTVVHT